ncbi:DNA cytosine methyltransferase [Flagellimonas marina]|uniref:Cytosine-specific methyltransferase n=1 Tax=Flagellimonas marina TaxID=1775168 RepID=A0ABV8PHT3_9FLAO
MSEKRTYIDLFAGCGGLSLGLNQSGWKGIFAIEKSPFAFSTLKHNLIDNLNHFDWPFWLDQKEHDINEVLKGYANELYELRGKVDLVAGGPPCQGFSTAGRRIENDKRNELIHSYIKFIRVVQPKIIFFENVKGFTQRFQRNKSKGLKYSELVEKSLRRSGKNFIGYDVAGELINFSDFGIPQKRTRFILVGIRKDIEIEKSCTPSNFFDKLFANKETFLINKGIGLNTSLKDAISDLLFQHGEVESPDSKGFKSAQYGKIESNYQTFLRGENENNIPDSHRFSNHGENTISLFENLIENAPRGKKLEGKIKKIFNIKKRGITVLSEGDKAPTLTSHPDDYVHYSEPRILTVREYARIQSFPDWYAFKEKYTTGGHLRRTEVPRYTQIGNAIPPLFGEQAGLALKDFINA